MNWKKSISSYFTFTRKDRVGILFLLTILLLLLFSDQLIPVQESAGDVFSDSSWVSALRKLEITETVQRESAYQPEGLPSLYQNSQPANEHIRTARQLFRFDPNTNTAEDWKKLGLKDRTIKIILNYINKGGYFRKPEDLQRIYTLDKTDYDALTAYINIEPIIKNKKDWATTSPMPIRASRYNNVEINIADTTEFIALPGIGSKLATRIVNFRNKLGGFYSVEQISETFGLPDSTFQKIKPYLRLTTTPKKININTATVDELKSHPYIKYNMANPLIAYRNEHGPYLRIEDIKKIAIVTDEIFRKLLPYLTAQ